MFLLKNDRYRKSRGGWSRALEISCAQCSKRFFHYQKDGPGPLKRCYLDRILDQNKLNKGGAFFYCPSCKELIGWSAVYKKEKRPIIRLFASAVSYKVIPVNKAV